MIPNFNDTFLYVKTSILDPINLQCLEQKIYIYVYFETRN